MNSYLMKLTHYIEKNPMDYTATDKETVWQVLYGAYHELEPIDTREIRERFDELDWILDKLTKQEYNAVWDLTCQLCGEHEKQAFAQCIYLGMLLATEGERDFRA